ncbi:sulfite oxidase isoform X1 [Physcomitrium patens]|uniref:sulfite oxidase isoform X1 n=1 Tax=Physcomitrium patens TaxID=3218 RepID=UPI003CCCA3E9
MQGIPYRTLETGEGGRYVEFISVDYMKETPDEPFKSSIPLIHATTPRADVLLAYEMNYEDIPREHGYPLRVIIPGCIGARSVKWLKEIKISKDECQGYYMQKHFKHYPPHLELDPPWVTTVDWSSRRPLMEFPVQSAICVPQDGIFLPKGATVNIRGYAIAGGGRAIDRVDVSVNSGHSWKSAERRQVSFSVPRIPCPCCGAVPHKVEIFDVFEADGDTAQLFDPQLLKWAWVLWKCVAQVYPRTEIIVKAIDSAGNVQPHEIDQIWNFRGVNNSCWNRVKVELSKAGCVHCFRETCFSCCLTALDVLTIGRLYTMIGREGKRLPLSMSQNLQWSCRRAPILGLLW